MGRKQHLLNKLFTEWIGKKTPNYNVENVVSNILSTSGSSPVYFTGNENMSALANVQSVPKNRTTVWLINPPSPNGRCYIRDLNRSGRLSNENTPWHQMSLALIAGNLENCNVRIIDCIQEGKDYEWLKKELKDGKPNWVIFNSISSILTSDMRTAFYAKSVGAKTITVGSYFPSGCEKFRDRFPSCDYFISGKPEQRIKWLIEKKRVKKNYLDVTRHDLLPKYRLPLIGEFSFVLLSRGCTNKCIFCRQTVTWNGAKNGVIYREPKRIVEEIKRYDLKNIVFHADTGTLNHDQMYELCELLEPLHIRWCCNARVDTVDINLLKAMKKAGCWILMYGIESGNQTVLNINKKNITLEDTETAIELTKKAGIKAWGYFMLGLLGDRQNTMEDTLDLSLRLPLDIANFAIATPYHGTEFFKIAKQMGNLKVDPDDYESFDQNYSAVVGYGHLPAHKIKSFQKYCYKRWYLRPYGLYKLFQIYGLRNIKLLFKTAINHLW